jgi:hypothetical protein
LLARRKSDPLKLGMAARLKRATTLSIKGIAARVHLGTSKAANGRNGLLHERSADHRSGSERLWHAERPPLCVKPLGLDTPCRAILQKERPK